MCLHAGDAMFYHSVFGHMFHLSKSVDWPLNPGKSYLSFRVFQGPSEFVYLKQLNA